jgi:hypothetical protein
MTTELEQRLRDALHEDSERARLVNPAGPPVPAPRELARDQPRRRSGRNLVAIAAAIALIAAAGVAVIQDGDRGPDLTYVGDPEDQAIVDAAVLTSGDVPIGWEAAPREVDERWQAEEDDLEQGMADCLGIDVSELQGDSPTARSAFVNSYEENDERVVSKVTAFASDSEARAVTDRVRDEATQQCYLAGLEAQIADGARAGVTMSFTGQTLSGDDIEIGESTVEELYWEYQAGGYYKTVTDDSVALRVTVPLTVDGVDVDVYADVAFVRKGRFLTQTSFQTYFLGFDGGPGASSLVAPPTAVRLTKTVVNRIPGATSPDPVGTVGPPIEPSGPLTEPGEQPADPDAAEEEVRAAFTGIFDASQPREDKAPLSERPAVWSAANQALVEGEYGEMVEGLYAVVDEVVFTSPTRAAVRFDLVTPGGYGSNDQIGHAVLVNGRWLVTIETTCTQVAIAGVQCDMSL